MHPSIVKSALVTNQIASNMSELTQGGSRLNASTLKSAFASYQCERDMNELTQERSPIHAL